MNKKLLIHTIWVGGIENMPLLNRLCLYGWKKQGFEVRIWTEDDLEVKAIGIYTSFVSSLCPYGFFAYILTN